MSELGSIPLVAASAFAICTPAEPIEMTPMVLPLRSVILCTGLSTGTAMP
jgi:hypothetical protein